jgi:signal transduction histidine kinase
MTERRSVTAALRDLLLAGALVVTGSALCVRFDVAERLSLRLLRWEYLQLDDLLLGAGLALAATGWFAVRRWREALSSLAARRQSEREKAEYVAKLEQLSAQLLLAEQTERTRIAELLHDEVGQTLYACRLQLERASARVADAEVRELLGEARALADDAMEHTRELTAQVSPPILQDLGLAEALEWLLTRTGQRFGITTQLVPGAAWQQIHPRAHDPIFQSVRELLTNAVKHAHASHLTVSALQCAEDRVDITVQDDGRGFVPSRIGAGFGLLSIERRMACLGAQLCIESTNERGTSASLRLPVPLRAPAE